MEKKCFTLPLICASIPASLRCFCTCTTMSCTNSSLCSFLRVIFSSKSSYTSGLRYFKARSSSSTFIFEIPNLWAIGEYISSVSLAFSFCFSGFMYFNVLILCSLSASFISMTLISFAIARNIFLRFSACNSILSLSHESCVSFVTPSTKLATSSPNILLSSASVRTVSSTTSCSIPATIVSLSSSRSASIFATQRGWII